MTGFAFCICPAMARPTPFEIRALELVTESAEHGGFWGLIADDTLNIIVRAVALDLQRAARRAEDSDRSPLLLAHLPQHREGFE